MAKIINFGKRNYRQRLSLTRALSGPVPPPTKWWEEFRNKFLFFPAAFRAAALPIERSARDKFSGERLPVLSFKKGKFLFFEKEFGGVFIGLPEHDPDNLGECQFCLSKTETLQIFLGKKMSD